MKSVCRVYVCLYRGILTISCDHFPVQHSLTGLGGGDVVFFFLLLSKNGIFKCYSDGLHV
jgi:hypothetical protein